MDTGIFAWTLMATLFAGLQTFTSKVVAHEKRDAAFNGMFTYGLAAVAGVLIVAASGHVPEAWRPVLFFGALSGGIHAAGNYLRIESLRHVDSVIYFPINKIIGPVLAVLGGLVLFGESLSGRQAVGILLSLTVPALLVSSAERHRQNDLRTGIVYLLISTALTVAALVLAKQALEYGGGVMFVLASTQTAGFLVSAALFRRDNRGAAALSSMAARDIRLGVLAGTLGFLAYITLLEALSRGYLSLVYVIHAHYILIPIILSVWLHKDHINVRKLAAIAVSSLAIILLYSA